MKPFADFLRRNQTEAGKQDTQAGPAAYWSFTPEQLYAALRTGPDGLQPADVEKRLVQYGPNAIQAQKQATAWRLFLNQFKSPLVLILIFAAIVPCYCERMDRCWHRIGCGAG